MPTTYAQTHRLLTLLAWVIDRRRFSATDAMRAFGVSRRTVIRDLDALRDDWRVPLEWDDRAATYLATEPVGAIAPIPIAARDLAAFLVARHALDALGDSATADTLAAVADRLAAALPPSMHVSPHGLARAVRFAPTGPATDTRAPWHLPILRAIEEGRLVRLRYRSASKDEPTLRDIEPYQLVQHAGRWYLVGYCHLRSDWRDLRLDRIETFEETAAVFARRAFDADAYLGASLGMHRGDRPLSVHVRFTPRQARWITGETYHETQVLARRADGSVDLRIQVAGLPDLVRWLCGYGAEVEVLAPPVLRNAVADAHRAAAAQYAAQAGPLLN